MVTIAGPVSMVTVVPWLWDGELLLLAGGIWPSQDKWVAGQWGMGQQAGGQQQVGDQVMGNSWRTACRSCQPQVQIIPSQLPLRSARPGTKTQPH